MTPGMAQGSVYSHKLNAFLSAVPDRVAEEVVYALGLAYQGSGRTYNEMALPGYLQLNAKSQMSFLLLQTQKQGKLF